MWQQTLRTWQGCARAAATMQIRIDLTRLETNSAYQYGLLAAITGLALALRFYKLGDWSFWGDEIITVRRASSLCVDGFGTGPISIMATCVSIKIWGTNEWSARLPAAVIGVLSVPILFFLVRELFDPAVALLASLLLAISPWHIYWSQNARFYTTLLLISTMSLLFFLHGIEKDRPRYLLLSLALLVLALQERLLAAFLIPVFVGYLILLWLLPFGRPAGLRARNVVILFGLAPLALRYLISLDAASRLAWSNVFGFANNTPFWILAGVVFYVGIPLISTAGVGGLYMLIKRRREAVLLILAAVIPLLVIMLMALFQYTANRYVFVSLTSLVILAAVALKELLWQAPKNIKLLAIGFVLILLLAPLGDDFLYYRYQNGNRENWRDAFALISAIKEDGDPVVTTHRALADYYMREATVNMLGLDLAKYVGDYQRVWFVVDQTTPDKAPQALQWILTNTHFVAERDVRVGVRTYPMRIYLYDSDHRPVYRSYHYDMLLTVHP